MKSEKSKRGGNGANRFFSQLAAEKKKCVMALCLITLMAFMWVRAFVGKKPESAEAAVRREEVTEGQLNSELKISFVKLPNVKGRNDVLTRDFFAVDVGSLGSPKKGNAVLRNANEEVIRRVSEKLKLEAIVLGENPRAFINDKLLAVGDELSISDGVGAYKCEVVGIEGETVFMRCGETEIQLKLTPAIEPAN